MNRVILSLTIAVGAAVLALLPVTTALGVGSEVRTLPIDLITPPPLEPGTYQTRPAFLPPTVFTLDGGWYGAQESHSGWCVGKGLTRRAPALVGTDTARRSSVAIGICAVRLGPSYRSAISRFKALTTLTAGPSKPIRVGGYPGVSFHAAVRKRSLLQGISPLIVLLPGRQQIFLKVRGKTVLLRIEISPYARGSSRARIPADDEVPP
jgi:hypothetical protein